MIKVMQHLESFTGTSFRLSIRKVLIVSWARRRVLRISGVYFDRFPTLQLPRRLDVLPAVWL